MYELTIKKTARKVIGRQTADVRQQMEHEIDLLAKNPDHPDLDISPVVGGPYLRLKFRTPAHGFRAIFTRDDADQKISIKDIDSRGQAYSIRRLQR